MAAAVANTKGDGSNTYLLLGPIGTGAFGNDTTEIAHVFRDVLKEKLVGMEHPVRYAFENIWFVSIDGWKNDEFEKVIVEDEASPPSTENPAKSPSATTAETKVEAETQPKAPVDEESKADGGAEPPAVIKPEKGTADDK